MAQNRVFSEIVTKELYQSTEEICNKVFCRQFFNMEDKYLKYCHPEFTESMSLDFTESQ